VQLGAEANPSPLSRMLQGRMTLNRALSMQLLLVGLVGCFVSCSFFILSRLIKIIVKYPNATLPQLATLATTNDRI
jgi:hypothetical protein